MPHFTYLIECQDGSYYCGYTPKIEQRMGMHRSGKGAKYVRAKGFKQLLQAYQSPTKSTALSLEYRIKKLSRNQKEEVLNRKELYFPSSLLGIPLLSIQ